MRKISARLGWSGFSAAAVSLIRAASAVVHRRPQVAARIWRRIRYAPAASMTGIACHRRDTSEWLFMNLTVVATLP